MSAPHGNTPGADTPGADTPGDAPPEGAPPPLVEPRPVYSLIRGFLVGWLGVVHRLKVEGREHLPRRGGVLLVSNHQSFLDIPILAVGAHRHIAYVARASLERSRFVRFLIRESDSVTITPNSPDRAALEGMIAHLRAGDCVAVFPEGTRTRDGGLGTFRGGALVAARRAGVPIVPAAITGAFEAWPRHRRLPRPRPLRLRFGPPLEAGGKEAMEAVRASIAGMIEDSGGPRR